MWRQLGCVGLCVIRWILFQFHILLDSIPIDILPQKTRMLYSQMHFHCIFSRCFICFADQATINYSFVHSFMLKKIMSRRKRCTTLSTFMILDSKMLVQMFSISSWFHISVRTILTVIEFIIMYSHMTVQWILIVEGWLTIWFDAFVPKIIFWMLDVHHTMHIQIFLNISISIISTETFFTFEVAT